MSRLRRWSPALAGLISLVVAVVALDRIFPPPIDRADNAGALVYDREGRLLHVTPATGGVWRLPADLDAIDPAFVARLLEIEDKRFFRHGGVDPIAIGRATVNSMIAGRIVSGASTITMQAARLLEPRPRTIGSKVIEAIRALQIERRMTKREILELYLTLTPYGGNIEGVRAASMIYFGKDAARLSNAEQALLIALPQAPEARRPDRRPMAALAGMTAIAGRLGMPPDALPPVAPARRRAPPRAAFHATMAAIDAFERDGLNRRGAVNTTLHGALQRDFEAAISRKTKAAADGATAAAIAVDAATGQIIAYVGSGGLDAPGGWIDLARAIRSPGSTLKPFVYGLAFDDGDLNPDSVMNDAPRQFDGYAPENFDNRFRGEVRVRDALRQSLNVPAVEALQGVGARRFGASLAAAGAALTLPTNGKGEGAGLPTALGGAGIRLVDLAMLYAGLERGGVVGPLTFSLELAPGASDETVNGYRLMSAASARRITAILKSTPSLEGRVPAALVKGAPAVAYKTGTSYGFRDAFAVGSAGGLTIAVWVGRADGAARDGHTGRDAAAPVLFELFDIAARHGLAPAGQTSSDDDPHNAPDGRWLGVTATKVLDESRTITILHPANGAELFVDDGAVRLAARGGVGAVDWYVDGVRIAPEGQISGGALWMPSADGFYDITAVDASGASASARARVTLAQVGSNGDGAQLK
ncbi:MAG: penicillin-binding protein 1C [Alphaproteobacteria bacterium]|nr:penicillin-binding protein 1C [Alphaproteobacteria bacterium]